MFLYTVSVVNNNVEHRLINSNVMTDNQFHMMYLCIMLLGIVIKGIY